MEAIAIRLEAISSSKKKLLGAPGIATRTLLGAPGRTTSNKKLLVSTSNTFSVPGFVPGASVFVTLGTTIFAFSGAFSAVAAWSVPRAGGASRCQQEVDRFEQNRGVR